MQKKAYVYIEMFVLFMALPVSLLFPYNFGIKALSILIAFAYLIIILFKKTDVKFKVKKNIDWRIFWKHTSIKFLVVAIFTVWYVWIVNPAVLFCVPLNKPGLWASILLVYTFLSVWPQEVIYRVFFFERYASVFKDKRLLIFVNAIVFSMAHLFFRNMLVVVLTFIGGLLFAYTYHKTRSTTLVSIEHALYGNWLFTVGMGEMLAFPGMEGC